jgi:hypothetical protein
VGVEPLRRVGEVLQVRPGTRNGSAGSDDPSEEKVGYEVSFTSTGALSGGAAVGTTVTCSATDAAGNTANGNFKVSVFYDFGQGSGGTFAEPVREWDPNQLKAGQAVPVKFGLGADLSLDIFTSGYPTAKRIDSDTGLPTDPVEETVTASTSGLQYDAASGLYTYVWKTQKNWSGTCREPNLKLGDGTDHPVYFQLK